jgi:hypothetical protein
LQYRGLYGVRSTDPAKVKMLTEDSLDVMIDWVRLHLREIGVTRVVADIIQHVFMLGYLYE